MAVIRRVDTLGIKTLLDKGEFGISMIPSELGTSEYGRIYVGTGDENIALGTRVDKEMAIDDALALAVALG